MSLPLEYNTASCYFEEVVSFLKTYEWAYNYPNTDILIKSVLENFPPDWLLFFKKMSNTELNNLSLGIVESNAPESLKSFFKKLNSFKPQNENNTNLPLKFPTKNLKISKKKQHEILQLSSLTHEICQKMNTQFIIDIGSGLGYLPELLHEKYNYTILGVEGSSEKFKLAVERQNTLYPNTKNYIKYRQHFVTETSATEIKNCAREFFPQAKNAVLTGLHACADLSVTILKLFLEFDFVRGLIIMPCCYHRLEMLQEGSNSEEDRFKNFPVSEALLKVFESKDGGRFLRKYFLRLACQQSVACFIKMSEDEHREHGEQCLFRAILEAAAREENCLVTRNKRKTGRPPIKDSNAAFQHYVTNLKNTHTLAPISNNFEPPLIDSPRFCEKMLKKWHEYKGHCYLVEILTAFQMAIQSVCENLVLFDRVEFLRARGVECRVCKVTDDRISPRCYALVATKL